MADTIPKQVKKEVVDGWLLETWKVALLDNTFVYDHTTDITYANVSDDEITGTGYSAGGALITGRTGGYVDTDDYYINANDTPWAGATFAVPARYAVVYETTGGKIRAIYDLGADYSVTTGTFTLQWHATGLIKIV
jgi:hypothetical protein